MGKTKVIMISMVLLSGAAFVTSESMAEDITLILLGALIWIGIPYIMFYYLKYNIKKYFGKDKE